MKDVASESGAGERGGREAGGVSELGFWLGTRSGREGEERVSVDPLAFLKAGGQTYRVAENESGPRR